MMLREERERIVEFGKRLITSALTTGSGGNLSILDGARQLVAITPSGVPYPEIVAGDVVLVNDDDLAVRANRLALLARIRSATGQVANFSKIAG